MSDERLDELVVKEETAHYGNAVRIERIKFTNYKFFHGEFELSVESENLLVYGENGSGKTSVYKALELLTEKSFTDFENNRNIFANNGEVEVEFGFNNGKELIISSDLEEMPDHVDFIKGLSVFKPMLDYKKLLKIHYEPNVNGGEINLYHMFRQLLKDYPVGKGAEKQALSEIEDLTEYFNALKMILEDDLVKPINDFLKNYFTAEIFIDSFEFKQKISNKETGAVEPVVNIKIGYKEFQIEKYHTFLNEARLSALAVSVYFIAIKKEFSDFQIFFFTHDKELYEVYKDKLNWKKYELYLDTHDEIPMPILKQGTSDIERAKTFYAQKEYDACDLLLRKGFEKILMKSYRMRLLTWRN